MICRITRAQVEALNPCAEGLTLFDKLAPSGVYVANTIAELQAGIDAVQVVRTDWVKWIPLGTGTGDGYGSGDGSGYGSGDGSGDGYGGAEVVEV